MKQYHFEQRYAQEWAAFALAVAPLKRRKMAQSEEAEPAPLDRPLPAAYRRLCQQLAMARARHYSPALIARLNRLALDGHHVLYSDSGTPWSGIANFLVGGFPRLMRQEWRLFGLVTLLFYGPGIVLGWLVTNNPELIYSVLDYDSVKQFEYMYDPENRLVGSTREADSHVLMFGYYIWNNIGIAFRTFAGGLLFGVGALFFIIYNGVFMGAITGHILNLQYSETFFTFVIAHGAFELTAIVIAGVAGLRLGLALLRPGREGRIAALRRAASQAIRMIYGAFFFLLIAAFIEAFWSSLSTVAPATKYQVGALCWAFVILYLAFAGRYHAEPVKLSKAGQ